MIPTFSEWLKEPRKGWLVLCLACLVLVGCERPKYGRFVSKQFYPAHNESILVPSSDGDGGINLEWQDVWVQDQWELTLGGSLKDGKWVEYTVGVPIEVFNAYSNNTQFYPAAED